MNATRHWRVLSRPGCGLCHEMAEALEIGFGAHPIELEWVDVDDDETLRERWGWLIPVLLDEHGEALCVTRFDAAAVAVALGCAVPRARTR